MPTILCPVCGCTCHLSVRDHKSWHEEMYPGIPPDTLLPGRCPDCWMSLAEGDPVVVRDSLTYRSEHAGERGVVTAIWTKEDEGSVYEVRLESGTEEVFVRAQLSKRSDGDR